MLAVARWKGSHLDKKALMIVLGIILLIVGFVAHIPILWTIGIIVAVIGLILALLGTVGHGLLGRRHYY
jgi:fatty acid desaturase